MKRKLIALCGVVLAFALTACGTTTSSSVGKGGNNTSRSSVVAPSSSRASSSKASTSQVHVHSFVAGAKTGAFTPETCSCGLKAYRFNIGDAAGWNDENSKMNGKEAPNNASTWSLAGLPAGKYRVDMNAQMTSSSHSDRHWYNHALNGGDSASSPDKESQSPFRYWVEVDDVVTNPDETKTFGELGMSADSAVDVSFISEVTIGAEAQNLVFKHGDIGYSVIVKYIRFVAK